MSVAESYNFRKIDDRVSTSGLLSEAQLQSLGEENYSTVINLLPEGSEYAIGQEKAIVESQSIDYVYIPVDFASPQPQEFLAFEQALLARATEKVHIHCAANYRVSAFFAIYAHRNLGWSKEDALAFIASVWETSEHPPWSRYVSEWIA